MMTDKPSPVEKKYGKWMLYAFWLILLVILTLWFGQWQDQRNSINRNPNQDPQSQSNKLAHSVILQANQQHHYLAKGSINSYPVTFLLDTGASDVVIPEKLAIKLGLKRGAANYATTANGTVEVTDSRINYLKIGNIILRDVAAAINPGMKGDEVLLGMSALKRLEFTQRGDKLILRQTIQGKSP